LEHLRERAQIGAANDLDRFVSLTTTTVSMTY